MDRLHNLSLVAGRRKSWESEKLAVAFIVVSTDPLASSDSLTLVSLHHSSNSSFASSDIPTSDQLLYPAKFNPTLADESWEQSYQYRFVQPAEFL